MSREFIKSIDLKLREICEQLGFKKKGYWFYKPLREDVQATIGFMKAHYHMAGHTFIGVTVGVTFQQINRMFTELMELDKQSNDNVVQTHICYLMPDRKSEWEIIEGMDNTLAFDNLKTSIERYALPFQERMSDIDCAFEYLLDDQVTSTMYLPIFYYLRGNKATGMKIIEKAVKRQQGRDPHFLKYAENYRNLPTL